MDSNKEYIAILTDSLKKKMEVLNRIKAANAEQKKIALAEPFDGEAFDANMDEKALLIKKLEELDKGFDTVYNRVREELLSNSSAYKPEIEELKRLIGAITGLSMDIQAEEQRNKALVADCFEKAHRKISDAKNTKRIAANYYQTMAKSTYMEPQFLDKKK